MAENIIASKNFIDRLISDLKKSLIAQTKEIFMLPQNEPQANKMSLASTIKEWCDSLSPSVFNHIFADGTDKCLVLFRTVTNDEDSFIVRLAKASTGLRIEDWDDGTCKTFTNKLQQYMTKPFSVSELLARVEALCRRVIRTKEEDSNGNTPLGTLTSGEFVLDENRRVLLKAGQPIELTQVEFQIMELFFRNPGTALVREKILKGVWGENYFGDGKIVDALRPLPRLALVGFLLLPVGLILLPMGVGGQQE